VNESFPKKLQGVLRLLRDAELQAARLGSTPQVGLATEVSRARAYRGIAASAREARARLDALEADAERIADFFDPVKGEEYEVAS
jgi:hypothetical protein